MQEALGKPPNLTSSREQSSVSGHPTHNPGIFVMHLSLEHAPSPWALLRTRECHAHGLRLPKGTKCHIPQVQGDKNLALTEGVEWRARDCLDDFTQQDEPCVAVLHRHPWRAGQGFSMHHGIDGTALVEWC